MKWFAVVLGAFTLSLGCSDSGGVDKPVIEFVN